MKKYFLSTTILLSTFFLIISCNKNTVEKVSGPYQQKDAVWAMTSSSEKQAKWVGQEISSPNGESNPADFSITITDLGNKRIEIMLIDNVITDSDLKHFPLKPPINFGSREIDNSSLLRQKPMKGTLITKKKYFKIASSYAVECNSNPDDLSQISFYIKDRKQIIQPYQFEANGFERVIRHLACK